jgi:hypothetical protein
MISNTSSMDTKHTEETLTILSDRMMSSLSSTKLSEYLMDAMEFLRNDDLDGWKRRFLPEPPKQEVKAKRLRQSPALAPYLPEDLCVECKSDLVIDDVKNGQVVCLSCGLIQLQGVFTADTAHCSYSRMRSLGRVHIHRYSRILNFMTIIRFAEGDTHPVVDDATLSLLRAELDGKKVNGFEVRKALCRLGLSRRYRRHSMTFVRMWGGELNVTIPGELVMILAKMFRRVEFFFDRHKHRVWPGRKTFFSYNFMLYQLLHEIGRSDLTGPHHLLKSQKLLQVQMGAYKRICQYSGFTCHQ